MNTNTQPKVYVLLKDLPTCKSGALFTEDDSCAGYSSIEEYQTWFPTEFIENNPEWFKEKQQPIEERIIVTMFAPYSDNDCYFSLSFSKPIHEEKHEAVKQAIEQVLNNEGFYQYGYTLAEYWHGEYLKLKELNSTPAPQPQDTKEDNPDYEILIIEYCGEQRFLRSDGLYRIFSDGVGFDLQYLLGMGGKIIQVARKSDNEVFTVGDVVNCDKCPPSFSQQVIEKFQIADKGFMIASCAGVATSINNISKKAPKEEQKPVPFEKELEHLINKHSMENGSDTPDYILAKYLYECLSLYNSTVTSRDISKI